MTTFLLVLQIVSNSAAYQCTLSPVGNVTKSDPKLLSGFNDQLGSSLQISYFDEALTHSAIKLWTGALRHPGGTIANYWNFSNASMITPCNSTYYNRCSEEERIDQWPLQSFSAKNFTNGIGTASQISQLGYNHTIVFDLNILTMSGDDLLNQINPLHLDNYTQLTANYFELGNEYYLDWTEYESVFANSTVYMNKALPLIKKIRNDFDAINPKIAAVGDFQQGFNESNEWNVGIVKFKEYYDDVTLHDYSLGPSMVQNLSAMDKISFISIYGQSRIHQWVDYVKNMFGSDKKIWLTEFNLGLSSDNNSFNTSIMRSVIHSMFVMSYISSSICTGGVVELLMYHSYNGKYNSTGTKEMFGFVDKANDIKDTKFNILAQISAHLNWIALVKNDRMHCLNADTQCPVLNVNVYGKSDLKCVFGVAFTNSLNANVFGFFLVNSCQFDIDISLNNNIALMEDMDVTLGYWKYLWDQEGDYIPFSNCESDQQLWECGPVKPEYKTMSISKSNTVANMTLSPLSLTLAVTQ
eukprot:533362_1